MTVFGKAGRASAPSPTPTDARGRSKNQERPATQPAPETGAGNQPTRQTGKTRQGPSGKRSRTAVVL